MIKNIFLFIILIALKSCAARGPAFTPASQPTSDRSLIYIYRQTAFCASLVNFEVSIDGKSLASIPNGGYIYFYIPPGNYTLTAKLAGRIHRSGLNTNPQETKYLELDPCPSGLPAFSESILFERSR